MFYISAINNHIIDFGQAFADDSLTKNALKIAQQNKTVKEVLGSLQPIDNMAILNGDVKYTNNNKSVELHVKISGSKGKANMDIIADKVNKKWTYKKLDVRIKKPIAKKQTIHVLSDSGN